MDERQGSARGSAAEYPYAVSQHARTVMPTLGRSVLRHPFVVILVTIVVAGLGYLWSSQQPERFTATTRLFLSSSSPFDGVGQGSFIDNPDRYAINQAALALSVPVLDRAIEDADLDLDSEELVEALAISAGRGNDVIAIDATAPSPTEAAAWSNAVAEAYRAFKSDEVERQTEDLIALSTTEEDRASVLKRAAVYGNGIALTEQAVRPTEPSHPQPVRDGMIAAILGAVLGVGAAVLVELGVTHRRRRNRTSRSAQTADEAPMRRASAGAPDHDGAWARSEMADRPSSSDQQASAAGAAEPLDGSGSLDGPDDKSPIQTLPSVH